LNTKEAFCKQNSSLLTRKIKPVEMNKVAIIDGTGRKVFDFKDKTIIAADEIHFCKAISGVYSVNIDSQQLLLMEFNNNVDSLPANQVNYRNNISNLKRNIY